jgi:phosphohistidine phosphatase
VAGVVELYLVRHAIAAERGSDWPDDDLRPLTTEGIRRFREVVAGFRGLDVELDVILTSPLVRAKQTATLLAEALSSRPRLKELPALAPGSEPVTTMTALTKATRARRLALVGHEPDLSVLAAYLLGARRPLPFKKGAICRIDAARPTEAGAGTLIWFAPPKLLRIAKNR